METPSLPTNFPCWVRAVYSWGGESKRDLGFIEGDLIECLNAGDGSWWMGRLKRDRRMVGLFPSNFVKVLENAPYQFSHQQSSAMSTPNHGLNLSRNSSPVSSGPSTPSPQKKSMFRKPFSATTSTNNSPTGSLSKSSKFRPYASMKQTNQPSSNFKPRSHAASPTIPSPIARGSSPYTPRESSRLSRSPSPQPQYSFLQHAAGFNDEDEPSSSPPPPPPPVHRVAYQQQPSTQDYGQSASMHQGYHTPRSQTPSNQPTGTTPSPLRDAINDVMTSLDDMSVAPESQEDAAPGTPPSIWSPEAFNEIYLASKRSIRSHTSQGLRSEDSPDRNHNGQRSSQMEEANDPQRLSSFVERMEDRLNDSQQHHTDRSYYGHANEMEYAPTPPTKSLLYASRPASLYQRPESSHSNDARPTSSQANKSMTLGRSGSKRFLRHRKSAFELGRDKLQRTFTTKTSVTSASSTAQSTSTNESNSTQLTSQSIMSGHSAGGFSATSAGSLARRKWAREEVTIAERPKSVMDFTRPETAMSGWSNHLNGQDSRPGLNGRTGSDKSIPSDGGLLGGFTAPKPKKTGFFKKMLESAKTSAASARSNMSTTSGSRPSSRGRPASRFGDGVSSISGGAYSPAKDAAAEMGLGGGASGGMTDWVQMRRDVNRSNSLSQNERVERAERCEMMDIAVVCPDTALYESTQGDESADGYPVTSPTDFMAASNLALVDKSARFVRDLPITINPISLAQGYLCRQYRSDVQKLRAIFTWVSERISLEDAYDNNPEVDTRRVLQTHRGCSEDIATLVVEMCRAIGIQSEVVRGYLKRPGEQLLKQDWTDIANRPNHAWAAVICDGEWRIMDCALASPSNPNRAAYSSLAGRDKADDWWFLARPLQICWTHVPLFSAQTHLSPPVEQDIQLALPVACPAFFRHSLALWEFDTSLLHLEGLEISQIQLTAPSNVEIYAEVETRALQQDTDGDYFESGEIVKKRALAQAEFISVETEAGPVVTKRYTVKALLPPSDSEGTLKIYAGGRGLMHSVTSNVHQLALALPLHQQGFNPPYDFFIRHPTPHALRNELYVANPLCRQLAINNTFVFLVRQHGVSHYASTSGYGAGSSSSSAVSGLLRLGGDYSTAGRSDSALSMIRPTSAMSMASMAPSATVSQAGSNSSSSSAGSGSNEQHKAAKLAIQSPSGKILRMNRKLEPVGGRAASRGEATAERLGSCWETIIKVGERGVWRGLVLADRTARWCVFGEWECV